MTPVSLSTYFASALTISMETNASSICCDGKENSPKFIECALRQWYIILVFLQDVVAALAVFQTNIYPERIVFDPCLQFFICSSAATKHFTVLEETIFTAVSELNFTFGKYHDNNAWNFFTSVPHSNNKQDELVSSTFNFQHGFQHDHLHSKIFDLAGKSISLAMGLRGSSCSARCKLLHASLL